MNLTETRLKLMKNPQTGKIYKEYDLALEIGLKIMKLRLKKGWTQTKLAQEVGTWQSSIARPEDGAYLPSLKFLNRVVSALRKTIYINIK